MKPKFTAVGRYFSVYVDGIRLSQHSTEREACEASASAKLENPDANVKYLHEYEVEVGLISLGGVGGGDEIVTLGSLALSNQQASSIQLDWTGVASSYKVYKSTTSASAGFSEIGPPTSNTYTDSTFLDSVDTWYYVAALDGEGTERETSNVANYSPPITGDNADRITAILAGRTVPFAYSAPADPSTAGQTVYNNVTTMSELQTRVGQSNVQINVAAGFGTQAGNVTITGSDVDLVVSNSATINGTISFSGNRTRWTGGNHTGGNLTCGSVSDVLIDNLNSLNENNATNNFSNFNSRFAIINTTFGAVGTASGNGWLVYTDQQSPNTGLILANVKFNTPSGRQTFRINQVTNYIAVDTYFNVGDIGNNSHRSHANTNTVFMDNCIIGNGWLASADANGGNTQWDYGIGNGTLSNMDIYSNLSAFIVGAHLSNVTISDSTLHSGVGAGTPGYGGLTNGGGNTRVAWNGAASGMPDGTGYGADH